ncbi:MAG: hypothetical protein LIO56_03995, partial [Lachnospiraceae bacterium]|nr:hypothetical protein [Lachnospiraceae bacterium]
PPPPPPPPPPPTPPPPAPRPAPPRPAPPAPPPGYREAAAAVAALPADVVYHDEKRSRYYDDFYRQIYLPFLGQWREIDGRIAALKERYEVES